MPTPLVASLVAELTSPRREVRVLPAGAFRASDGSGRPEGVAAWRLDAATAAALIARFNARTDRRVIDYEHATLTAAQKGGFAPAAGWFSKLEWRDPSTGSGQAEPGGLYATDVEWTAPAAAMIGNREYRYLSPVFNYDHDGTVLNLLHAGLTNNPGLDGLTDLAALSAQLSVQHSAPHFSTMKETPEMDLKKLLAAIGLADDKTEADALTAVAAMKAKAESADGQIAALTAQVGQPDPAKYVPISTHAQTQNALAALTAQVEATERDGLMTAALSDGRILPAQDAYWRAQPVAALKAYLEVAQPVAALSGTQTGGKPATTATGKGQPDAAELAAMKALGMSADVFATGKISQE